VLSLFPLGASREVLNFRCGCPSTLESCGKPQHSKRFAKTFAGHDLMIKASLRLDPSAWAALNLEP
jgi:hypothetical protein